jgi:hypothetical protein
MNSKNKKELDDILNNLEKNQSQNLKHFSLAIVDVLSVVIADTLILEQEKQK